ncbi:homeobox protein Rhox5-like [Acomys russatus]|uniref:homeobox protein Rhox5-like n=1 Tax=Acomys russatus TaxID=60746 RepID=UPI0021E28DCC|nr:homeobox protein Rhox5-like [Acomys russatus]
MERGNTNSLLLEGLQEDEEKLNGVKAQMALPLGEGRSEGESGQGQPGSGATAAEGEEIELNGDRPSTAAAAADQADNCNQEDQGARGPGQESDKQPKEPAPMGMDGPENVMHVPVLISRVQPVSVLVRRRCFQNKFAPWQLRELERIFKQNHFINALERKQLARWMGVSEARVQNWFKGRREQYRRHQKLLMLRGASFPDACAGDLENQPSPAARHA